MQAGKPQNRAAAPHTKTSREVKAQVPFRRLVQTKKVREDTTSLTFLYSTAWQVAASAFLRMRLRQHPRTFTASAQPPAAPHTAPVPNRWDAGKRPASVPVPPGTVHPPAQSGHRGAPPPMQGWAAGPQRESARGTDPDPPCHRGPITTRGTRGHSRRTPSRYSSASRTSMSLGLHLQSLVP